MTLVTRAEFARLKGWNRSSVTRAVTHGRIVMDGDLVDVEASEARLAGTSGGRDDVAARHAAARAAAGVKVGAGETAQEAVAPPSRGTESRSDAQARKESAAADLLEIELDKARGNVINRDDVDAAMRHLGAAVRSAMDVFPDQTAPLVAPVTNLDEVHSLLAEACRSVLDSIDHALARQQAALANGSGQGAA